MSRHEDMCPHCKPRTEESPEPKAHAPVVLPSEPRLFRVHNDGRTQDCTLHPDGRMTMQIGSEVLVSSLSFDEMCAMNWEGAHIEWDPQPLPVPSPPAQVVKAEPLALALPAAA